MVPFKVTGFKVMDTTYRVYLLSNIRGKAQLALLGPPVRAFKECYFERERERERDQSCKKIFPFLEPEIRVLSGPEIWDKSRKSGFFYICQEIRDPGEILGYLAF